LPASRGHYHCDLYLYNRGVRILLLNLYYPPDISATAKMTQSFAEALAVEHEVTILCGRPSYDPTERRHWKLWQTEQLGRLKIIRVGSTDFPRLEMKRRVLNYLSYVALSVPRALVLPCDVVLAMTDPPFEGIVGAWVALAKRKPYVYNIRDLYPDMAVAGSVVDAGLLTRVWEILHRWALGHVTRVIVLGEDMRARIIGKGVTADRVAVVRDGTEIPADGTPQAEIDQDVIRAIRGEFRFVLLHAGNLGFYGAWETLIAAAGQLGGGGVGLVFVGDGAQRAQLQAAAGSLKNVRFLPFFPASKIQSVLASADAHIVTIKRGLEGLVVPSKMYGILAAGKPIVSVAPKETDVSSLCRQFGCGISCDPARPEELVAAIRELADDSARLETMGKAAKSAAVRYNRVFEVRKFLHILKEASQR
jgi:colanic acid biosynthesis glycosyl transferase WcaI